MNIGLIIVGDEILSGKRQDKHLAKVIELLAARGLALSWARYVGDDRPRITPALRDAFTGGDLVFCYRRHRRHARRPHAPVRRGGAGRGAANCTPRPRTLILERMRDVAAEQGLPFEADRADNLHRLNMGVFPAGATLIPNPYNKIPGFSVGHVHFVPGFPVMAWPMIEWVLDQRYAHLHGGARTVERSVIVFGAMEASLTPLMEAIEHPLPGRQGLQPAQRRPSAVGPPYRTGRQGARPILAEAFAALRAGLDQAGRQAGR